MKIDKKWPIRKNSQSLAYNADLANKPGTIELYLSGFENDLSEHAPKRKSRVPSTKQMMTYALDGTMKGNHCELAISLIERGTTIYHTSNINFTTKNVQILLDYDVKLVDITITQIIISLDVSIDQKKFLLNRDIEDLAHYFWSLAVHCRLTD